MAYKVYKGTTSVDVTTDRVLFGGVVERLIITNKGIGTVTLNVQLYDDENYIQVSPLNLQLATGTSYADRGLVLEERDSLKVDVAGGEVDYYFSIKINDGVDS